MTLVAASLYFNVEALMYIGAGLNGGGLGSIYVCNIKTFKQAWSHLPGFAAGWMMFICSAGSFAFVWIANALLEAVTPAITFTIVGGIVFLLQCSGSVLFAPTKKKAEDKPPAAAELTDDEMDAKPAQSQGKQMSIKGLFTSLQFWLVIFALFASIFPMLGILSILVPHLEARFGTSSTEAANLMALVNVVGMSCRRCTLL